jgi:GTP cyclohydrolase I
VEKLSGPPQREAEECEGAAGDSAPAVDLVAAARAIEAFLTALGHPPSSDPQLHETGQLVAAAFHHELLSGYRVHAADVLRDTLAADGGGDMVLVRDIAVTCICPHHLLPATGRLHIGYLPQQRIVGLGALTRLAHAFSRRLILQEALCSEIAEALVRELGARGAGCIAELSPTCMTARGDRASHAQAVTVATAGLLQTDAELRREFFALARRPGTVGGGEGS